MLFKVLYRLALLPVFFYSCNNTGKQGVAAADSSATGKDTVVSASDAYENCYQNFFKGLPKPADSAGVFLLLQNGQKASMAQFFKDEFMSQSSGYGEKDLDGDGAAELVIYNNTGGAHCCDEYYIFQKKTAAYYEFKARLAGGNACVDAAANTFTFSFDEMLGYFFGCYACGFSDSTTSFSTMREITLKYNRGRLEVIPYGAAAEKQNIANLEILQKHGYEKLEDLMDSGWRKEFAMNLAVWHYNHGKNWSGTEKLFNTYYQFADAQKIWDEFHTTLSDAEKDGSF